MQREYILGQLQEIFHDVFDDEILIISEEMNANDIAVWDSLKHISILVAIQDEFSVEFSMDEIVSIKSVGDMIDAIQKKCNS